MSNVLETLVRYKNLIVGCLIFALLFLAVSRFTGPTIQGILEAQSRIEEQKVKLQTLDEKEALLKSTDKQTLISQMQRLTEAIPQTIDLPLIVATLQKGAQDAGIALGEFSIASNTQVISLVPIEEAERLSRFQFKVVLVGGADNIEQFIERVGTVSPLLGIESTEFLQDKSTVVFNFYFQPQSTVKFSSDASLRELTNRHTKTITEVFGLEPPVLEVPSAPQAEEGDRPNPFR